MTKINPGSNVHGENDTRTALPGGMQDVEIPEPKMTEKNIFQCPVCKATFSSREKYLSHAMAKHQPETPKTKIIHLNASTQQKK